MSFITAQDKAQLDMIFSIADANKDNALSKEEVNNVVKAFANGSPVTYDEAKVNMIWSMIDTNKDGVIQYEELVKAIETFGSSPPMMSLRSMTGE